MPGARTESPTEEIPLPRVETKHLDFALGSQDVHELPDVDRERLIEATQTSHHDSDTDSDATEDSDDDFDWEADDDARSTKGDPIANTTNVRRGRAVWRAFMKLSRPVRTLIIAVLGTSILITPLLVYQLRFNNTPGRTQAHVWSLWMAITWAASCGTYLIVDLTPVLALAVFRLFSHRVERMQITVELTSAVLGWLKFAMDVTWSWIALSVIRAVYKPTSSYWTVINRVMQALFAAALLLLAEKIFLRYVAINFHRRALADRISENQTGLRALDRLSNATPNPSARRNPYGQWRRGHRTGSPSAHFSLGGGGTPSQSVPGSSSSSPIGEKPDDRKHQHHKHDREREREDRQKRKRRPMAAVIVDNLVKNQNTEGQALYSASKLARKLFAQLSNVYPPRQYLIVEDFYPYFKNETDARDAFAVFDKDGNGDISKREMREAVRRIYRERKALTASLKDVGSAVAKLDAVLIACVLLVEIFICLLIFNKSNTIASLVPLATIILGFSFVFGHSAQTLFESLIFIFSTHVFDVGDLVLIDDQPLFVREFGLFSTTFRRVDGQEIIAPNSLLAGSKLVHNLRRSSSMWEYTDLMVAYDTPLEILEQLRKKLDEYINDDKNRREWSNINVNIEKMEFQNAIHLKIGMEHRPNWQDWGGRWARRTAFMRFLKVTLEELDLRYTKPVQPVIMPGVPPGWGGPRSPYLNSPRMPTPSPRFSGSRDTLSVPQQDTASRDTLSFRSADLARAASTRLR
ncbi:mechanosensitive ion channel-domain-containing protein [Phanerochaete sordida]|uniref:Mechanosensitive ion channel-domain-containing protein n=1 Tax=Phanerochaete sordida TaxID=48140 RepID=A0A9P3GA35_9APHY|nr:mechanosensitive ion channel-domain-containing protein [Phanerochaete sordida]